VVSIHLESKTDPADRQRQVQTLLQALEDLIGNAACVLGGDFNTKALPKEEGARQQVIESPEAYEPFFADLRAAGFAWQASNLAQATQRDGPWKTHERPLGKLDWIFTRGVKVSNPRIVPAIDDEGRPLSDHEMITVELSFKE
jgi:endonuclease/exonuclease/phosphatase family metal-dependent hydrolase